MFFKKSLLAFCLGLLTFEVCANTEREFDLNEQLETQKIENVLNGFEYIANYFAYVGKFFSGISETYKQLNEQEKQEFAKLMVDIIEEYESKVFEHQELASLIQNSLKNLMSNVQENITKDYFQIKLDKKDLENCTKREADLFWARYYLELYSISFEHSFKFYEEIFVFIRKLDDDQKKELLDAVYDFVNFAEAKSKDFPMLRKFEYFFVQFKNELETLKQ